MNMQELNLLARALLVWAAVLTAVLVFAGMWAYGLEDRIRRRIAEDMRKALGVERLLK